MSNKVTKGTPVSAKTEAQEAPISLADLDNQLAVDPKLIAEFEAAGLAHRWINAIKYKNNYGYDARMWQPYVVKKTGLENNYYGFTDDSGYIRRGDLILAVRKKELHEAVRERNANKIRNLAGAQRKNAKAEMEKTMREAGVDGAKIFEGYDEND